MKFVIAALLFASSSAVKLSDDCKGTWCNKGLTYDYNQADLNKAWADNVEKTGRFLYSQKALEIGHMAEDAATAAFNAASQADAAASSAKAAASATFAGSDYTNRAQFKGDEFSNFAAVKGKEAALDAKWRAEDELTAKSLVLARRQRDFDAAKAAKEASDANLKANQERFATEQDELVKGQDQDRLKFVNMDTAAELSRIQGKHWDRQYSNGNLKKALASF